MDYQKLYVVCQIDDFNLKVMVNQYVNNKVQVLYKENIENEQFAENGVIINPELTAKTLQEIISRINNLLKVKIERIALNLPSNNLKIYQSQAMLDFKEINHQITSFDVNKVIEMTKNIVIDNTEIICLTKPYNFKVDNNSFSNLLPLNSQGQILSVESLIYSLPKKIYNSQIETFNKTEYGLLSVTLDQFALVFNLKSFNNLILIDWAMNNTKISLFNNSTLYAINNIKIGFNQIVQALMNKMRCTYSKAVKYLTKVINLDSDYLGNFVVDKYFEPKTKKFITLSKLELQNIVRTMIDEIIEHIEYFLKDILDDNPNISIVFAGVTINLSGFTSYIKNFERFKKITYLESNTLGIYDYEWATLIGTTHYQHNLNLFNNVSLTSINNKEVVNQLLDEKKEDTIDQYHSQLNLNYQYND